jgi:hypothetical protein
METKEYDLKPIPRKFDTKGNQDEIYLSIKIGNGQIGGNQVLLDGKVIAKGNLTEPTYIGGVELLKDKVISVETNVLDVNGFTNRCVITTSFVNQDNEELYSKIDKGDAPENGVASFKGKYLVKYALALLMLFSFFNQNLLAQNNSENIEFSNLETPTSPGLVLFDETPSSIEKPTTPQGLGLNLLGLAKNGGALEFAPFWLKDHPNLKAEDMYKTKMPILSHFGVSVATISSDTLTFISGGIRTRLFQSYGKKVEKLDSLKTDIENLLSSDLIEENLKKIDSLRQKYVNITEKPVFNIDLAAAIGASTETNSYSELELSRWAIWTTFNFRPKGDDFYFTALARYINNEDFEGTNIKADLVDLGTRFNYDISKFTVSLEYIQRLNTTTEVYDDYRIAVIGSYKLSDNVFVTSTFGKNFDDVNNIIALAGLNFGFSKKKVKAF